MKKIKTLVLSLFLLAQPLVAFAGSVNVNMADADALAAGLQGVGLQKAEAIVAHREEHGPFQSADDLLEVRGIGPAIVDRNRELIVVE